MITKQQKTPWRNKGVVLAVALAFLSTGIVSCSKFSKEKRSVAQTDSISRDSIVATPTEKEAVKVDPSLVRSGDMGYSLYESNGNDEGVGNNQVELNYVIEHGKCTNYSGTLFYPNEKNPDEKYEIGVLGEVADDGGLIFSGKLDNTRYAIHIKNTHNSAAFGNQQRYDAEMTVGGQTRNIFMMFEHAGESGD